MVPTCQINMTFPTFSCYNVERPKTAFSKKFSIMFERFLCKSLILWNIMVLLTNCEVHTGKYSGSIRASLYSHNQRPKPSLNSVVNIFVSSLNAAVGREFFFSSYISFKVQVAQIFGFHIFFIFQKYGVYQWFPQRFF